MQMLMLFDRIAESTRRGRRSAPGRERGKQYESGPICFREDVNQSADRHHRLR
jgi:hypothetical protein